MRNGDQAEKLNVSGQKKEVSRGPPQEGTVTWGTREEPTKRPPLALWETERMNKVVLVEVTGTQGNGVESMSHSNVYF